MKTIEHWKEGLGVILYFGFLAFFTPRAEALGWGYRGILMCVVAGALLVLLLYAIVREIALLLEQNRDHVRYFKEYMGIGDPQATTTRQLETTGTLADIDARLSTNPYAVPELFEDDSPLRTLVLEHVQGGEETRLVPELDEDETRALLEPGGLDLAENFRPDVSSLVCQNITFIGVRRRGKSNAMSILLRRLAEREFPLFVFDTEDEFSEMARACYMPRGVLVGSDESREDAPDGVRFFSVTRETAYEFAQGALAECLQLVINMKAWPDDEAGEIMSEMILGIEEWEQAQGRGGRIPVFVAVGEITKWCPQNLGESVLDRRVLKLVQHALFDVVVRRGGKRGYGLITDAQKYADMDKRLLQGQWRILFAQTEINDLQRLRTQYPGLDMEVVAGLGAGESFVFCPQRQGPLYVKWPLSDIPLGGSSPSLAQLKAHHRKIAQSVTGVLSQLEMRAALSAHRPAIQLPDEGEEVTRFVPHHPGSPMETLPPKHEPVTAGQIEAAPPKSAATPLQVNGIRVTLLQRVAYELITEADCTTIAQLAAALTLRGDFGKVDHNRAYRVRGELQALGLIPK